MNQIVANISLRGIDEETAARLKEEAKRRRVSVNALILNLIKSGVEAGSRMRRRRVYHDLDALAGTWTAEEASEFLKAVADFEEVDQELWR